MTQSTRKPIRKFMAGACWFTALVNLIYTQADAQPFEPFKPLEGEEWTDNPLKYGPFDVRPGIRAGATYDSNIFASATDEEDDFILSLSPTILLGAGDYAAKETSLLTLRYTPSFLWFLDNSDENSIDHEAELGGQYRTGPAYFKVNQTFRSYSGSELDAGTRVDRNLYGTYAVAGYEISPKTSFELNGTLSVNDYDDLNSYNEWMVAGFVDYELSAKVKLGGGINGGWVDRNEGFDSQYQQLLMRATYSVTEKVDFRGTAGVQFRQYDGDADSRVNGIFAFGAVYRPWENTVVTLEGYRRDYSSVVEIDQEYTLTGVDASVRRAVTEKITVYVGGGYSFANYREVDSSAMADREDNYFTGRTGAEWGINDRASLGLFYQFRTNDSSDDPFSFDNHLVGLSFAYRL